MLESIENGYDFERHVCRIIYKTNPDNLSHYDGGPDRGRDICVEYHENGKIYNVIIECKFYNTGVSKEVIMPALNWATVHQPALLYFWIVPYLTPSAKDFIKLFEQKYKISVRIEENVNIEEYIKYINDDNAKIWSILRQKILNSCKNSLCAKPFIPEYELDKSESSPFLVDRKVEREKLFYNSKKAFYLQGVSACGKTQLLKYVASVYMKKGLPVFWHTIRPGESSQQCSDFYHTLARYFESIHQDQTLLDYFGSYGFFLSQDMENLVSYMLKKHNTILILDDVHNCQNENISMRNLFEKLIKHQVCRIYFSGWFNIFNFTINENKYFSSIILEGMKKKELNQIIKHCSGAFNPAMADLIEHRFYGLPGYAVLTDKEMTVDQINVEEDFLVHFLSLLSTDEQIVLFTLSFLSTDVPGDFLKNQGYAIQLVSLENKHLLVARKHHYTVHDKYRVFFSKYSMNEDLLLKVIFLMNEYALLEPSAYLDLINLRILEKKYSLAWDVVVSNFQVLISCQLYNPLLKKIQEIEQNTKGNININDIVMKKIVLLERLGEYSICLHYINLLDDTSLFNYFDQEMIFYIHLRCLYFTNQYESILKLYKEKFSNVENFSDRELYIQVLLIIGRVFYIRGSSKGALIFYLLAYQNAQKIHKNTLEVKAIHRIAMIERRLGLAKESRRTFQELLKLEALITPKRRSYIFFRIAKCFLNEGDLEEAKENNIKSIKIKESYNDTRGLLFSDNLNAMISLKEKDYLGAYCYSTNACNLANTLGLHKEWLSAMIIQLNAIINNAEMLNSYNATDIDSNLQRCLKIAVEDKLIIRLRSIEELTLTYCPNIYLVAKQNRERIEAELKKSEDMLLEYYVRKQGSAIQQDFETLIIREKSISQSLLLRSGFLDLFLLH